MPLQALKQVDGRIRGDKVAASAFLYAADAVAPQVREMRDEREKLDARVKALCQQASDQVTAGTWGARVLDRLRDKLSSASESLLRARQQAVELHAGRETLSKELFSSSLKKLQKQRYTDEVEPIRPSLIP